MQGIEFSVTQGKILGLLGPNGAGKTTTMRIMSGFLDPTKGDVTYNGISVLKEPREVKRKLGYLPEHAPLYNDMLVSEYLEFIAKSREVPKNLIQKSVNRVVGLCELESHFYQPVSQLSKGFRQRVALAGTLIHDPDFIILDEPSTGLDPNQITEIRSIIRNLGKSKTLILSTHILQEVVEICDRVIILSQGKIVVDSSVEELRKDSLVYFSTPSSEEILLQNFHKFGFTGLEKIKTDENGFHHYIVDSGAKGSTAVFSVLAEMKKPVAEIRPYQRSLESIFSELTKGGK
ncbi:MAG: ATP-binding cassette domain-containing protein [Leptospira sp.]|nr:ATP-binding cassette domain-containing protein [Leptospira sp.]